jgi:hypothetical protein
MRCLQWPEKKKQLRIECEKNETAEMKKMGREKKDIKKLEKAEGKKWK